MVGEVSRKLQKAGVLLNWISTDGKAEGTGREVLVEETSI